MVINLGQGRPDLAFSNLTLSFIQPLFRGGGLAVTLEDLTEAERTLVYAIRSYARFRKLFYVSLVAAGGNITNNPYGLQGLSANLGRGIGNNLTAPAVGYLPLLQQAAIIANQQRNVAAQERLLRQYEAFREGGQCPTSRSGRSRSNLLKSQPLLGQARWAPPAGGWGWRHPRAPRLARQLQAPARPAGHGRARPGQHPAASRSASSSPGSRTCTRTCCNWSGGPAVRPGRPGRQFRPRWRRLLTESGWSGDDFAKEIGAAGTRGRN